MKTILTTLLSTCFAVGVCAQPSPSTNMAAAPGAAATRSDVSESLKMDNHLRELHTKLQINAAEEAQWALVATAMRDSALQLDAALQAREAASKTASAVEDLNAYGTVAQAHADGVKKLAAAFGPLYAAMSSGQRQIADEVFSHRDHAAKKAAVASK